MLSVTITIFTTAGWVGERAREVVDRERGARPRDEEVARAAEGVGGTGEGEEFFPGACPAPFLGLWRPRVFYFEFGVYMSEIFLST